MPSGDWLYAYGVTRCVKCRNVFVEHYPFCDKCGAANAKVKSAAPDPAEESAEED